MDHELAEINQEPEEVLVEEEELRVANLGEQALWVLINTMVAAGTWGGMMLAITLAHPQSVPAIATLGASFFLPLVVGYFFTKIRQNEMGPHTWLVGLIWFLIICLWILDMPTGPNQCYHCDASQKLYLTFFSLNEDSGLIDGEGRFLGTWPTAAFIGYGIGAGLALKKKA
ncbi:hypothetical protein ACFPT7_14040 [Acidicapsa dinghuensis]|uniref:Uncharacterized protein n=1 Tax=Acidicapsa dinghuensis TaxID=2218256 RepID=A0ABW1EGL8_9BACT|nr:hypothetical protein [Acidicapsa dinghuensis]